MRLLHTVDTPHSASYTDVFSLPPSLPPSYTDVFLVEGVNMCLCEGRICVPPRCSRVGSFYCVGQPTVLANNDLSLWSNVKLPVSVSKQIPYF